MIQKSTLLNVADNSGALLCMCIGISYPKSAKVCSVGDIIVVSIKSTIPNAKKVKKGAVMKAVVVRVCSLVNRPDGSSLFYGDNAVVLIDQKGAMIGTRVIGPVSREVRNMCPSVVSLASEVR